MPIFGDASGGAGAHASERIARPSTEGLAEFRRIDLHQTHTDLVPIKQDGQRIAIVDVYDLRIEVCPGGALREEQHQRDEEDDRDRYGDANRKAGASDAWAVIVCRKNVAVRNDRHGLKCSCRSQRRPRARNTASVSSLMSAESLTMWLSLMVSTPRSCARRAGWSGGNAERIRLTSAFSSSSRMSGGGRSTGDRNIGTSEHRALCDRQLQDALIRPQMRAGIH